MRMNIITIAVFPLAVFSSMGTPLLAQAPGNVAFSTTTTAVGAIGGGFTGMLGAGPQTFAFVAGELSGDTLKGAPYSAQATTRTTQTLADGNQIVNVSNASVYRDAEGRMRREQSLPNIGPFSAQDAAIQTVFISDPVAGVNYSLNPSEHVAIKLPVPQGMANTSGKIMTMQKMVTTGSVAMAMPLPSPAFVYRSATSGPPSNLPVVEQLGTQSIEGVQAVGTRTTMTIPAGQIGNSLPLQIVDEMWRSPDLQVIVQSSHSDPRMGATNYTLTNISRNDPSPSLFQVPADYTIKDSPAMFQKVAPPAPPQ